MGKYIVIVLSLFVVISACKQNNGPNPFDDPALKPPVDSGGANLLSPTSFAGLHKNIFKPTCANSGCHDGNFEPDYRTIEGTYNTLVYHPIIKNNVNGDFEFRVKPFDVPKSVLIERLTNDIDGFSGIMPLEVDPGSDWPSKKDEYIDNIRTWINEGALDMFGNPPVVGNKEPQMLGVSAFANGTQLLGRNPGNGAIMVPGGTNSIDIWFSVIDDSTSPTALSYNKIKFSLIRDDFSLASEESMNIIGSPKTENGYFGDPVNHYHKYTLSNPSSFGPVGTVVFFRIYVKDPQHDITEIPEDGSFNYIKEYFAFEII